MRIAMIGCKGIPAATSHGGGIETHVEELSTRLVADGNEVAVYVRPYANPDRKTSYKGVRLITIPTFHSKHLDTITHTSLSTIHALFQPFDVLHYHGVGPSTLAWIPRVFRWPVKVVVTFHSRDRFHEKWEWFARAYLAFGEWTAVNFPHATIAASHEIKLFCRKRFGRHAWYIPNGVPVPELHPGTDRLASFGLEADSYFFCLSRLVPHKAIEDAINAFRSVETDKKLVIIGSATPAEASYQKELERLSARDPRVLMLGRRVGTELAQLIANSYAMIHPSRSEGLSVAVLEGMSYGKLVVMSDIPENLELVDHSGIAYKVGNISALRDAIVWTLHDPEMVRERGERARRTVQRLYAWTTIVSRTEALYSSLVS